MSKSASRRAVLAGIAATPAAVAAPAAALTALSPMITDPILAAIEARKQTCRRSFESCHRLGEFQDSHRRPNGEFPSVEDHPELDELQAENDDDGSEDVDAVRSMFLTVPTTLAGALALCRYIAECEDAGDHVLLLSMDDDAAGHQEGRHALLASLIAALTPLAAVRS